MQTEKTHHSPIEELNDCAKLFRRISSKKKKKKFTYTTHEMTSKPRYIHNVI